MVTAAASAELASQATALDRLVDVLAKIVDKGAQNATAAAQPPTPKKEVKVEAHWMNKAMVQETVKPVARAAKAKKSPAQVSLPLSDEEMKDF